MSDVQDRKARGEPAVEARVLAENPDLADDLRRFLSVIGDLQPAQHAVAGLVAQGVLTESEDPDHGPSLGSYKTIEFIDRGAMGIVLKAREEALNRDVALKIMRPELANDTTALERFKREAKALGGIRHANIVTVYAVGEEQGVHFLAMEYIAGPTLRDVITTYGPLPADVTRRWLGGLLAGLDAAHRAKLIHRDIKPSNIMLDGWPTTTDALARRSRPDAAGAVSEPPLTSVDLSGVTPKITDFGLVRVTSAQAHVTTTGANPGTPLYMSPEQANGAKKLDARSDLYSVGVVLYEMLTGRTPHKAPQEEVTEEELKRRIVSEEPEPPGIFNKQADPHLSDMALRLLAKHPEDRFASASKALKALDSGDPVTDLAKRRRRRRRWKRLAGSLAALLAVVVAAWAAIRVADRPPTITSVRVDPYNTRAIQVRFDHQDWAPFLRIPHVAGPVGVADIGEGTQAVIVGLKPRGDEHNLYAFDVEGEEIWKSALQQTCDWPDYNQPQLWSCEHIAISNLDGEAGDEVVVCAQDPSEYPTRLSIVDARTGNIEGTFWHFGHIDGMLIVPDYFQGDKGGETGEPAILAWGKNNKLDGFTEPRQVPGDDPNPLTDHDTPSVVMILNPRRMIGWGDGLGPPHTRRVAIPQARPYAYVLIAPPGSTEPDSSLEILSQLVDSGLLAGEPEITDITLAASTRSFSDDSAWFVVRVVGPDTSFSAQYYVNWNLGLIPDPIKLGDKHAANAEHAAAWRDYWTRCWRPIIRQGEFATSDVARHVGE